MSKKKEWRRDRFLHLHEGEFRDHAMRMILEDPMIILVFRKSFATEDLWKLAIDQEPSLYGLLSNPSLELSKHAIQLDGQNLKHCIQVFGVSSITRKMIFDAIQTFPAAILDVDPPLLDVGLMEIAFHNNPALIAEYVELPYDLQEKLVKENPSYIQYLPYAEEKLKNLAIELNSNVCVYFQEMSESMWETLKTHHPETYEVYRGEREEPLP